MEFDQNKRFLVGYGGEYLYIYNLKDMIGTMYELNPRLHKKILHMNFKSSSTAKYCCYVAC